MKWQGVCLFLMSLWVLPNFRSLFFPCPLWLIVKVNISKVISCTNTFSEACNWSEHSSAVSEMGNRRGAEWRDIPATASENQSFLHNDWCHYTDRVSPLQLCDLCSGNFLINIFYFIIPNSGTFSVIFLKACVVARIIATSNSPSVLKKTDCPVTGEKTDAI